jgi:hypothetical protein
MTKALLQYFLNCIGSHPTAAAVVLLTAHA